MRKKNPEIFLDYFDDIEDPRSDRNKLYTINEILLVTICALICGADSWRDLVEFGEAKLDLLREYLPYKYGIPSKNTFCRFFASLNPKEFKGCFIKWVSELSLLKEGRQKIIAIDGKQLCNSFDKKDNKSAIHIVSAFATETRLILGQQKVTDKSNEITAIPELLKMLDLRNGIVTIDAMGTQKKIAKQIIKQGGEYILALKGNHTTLHTDVINIFNDKTNIFYKATDIDCGHGRIEERTCYAIGDISWLQDLGFDGLKSVICIEAKRTINKKTTEEKRYYISSLSASNPAKLNSGIRSHWGVENSLHWTLDTTFNEDNSRIRADNAAENIAMMRHTTINLLHMAQASTYKKNSIKGLRKKAGWDNSTLRTILNQGVSG